MTKGPVLSSRDLQPSPTYRPPLQSQKNQSQRNGSGNSLNKDNLSGSRQATVGTSHANTSKEEELDLSGKLGIGVDETPEEASGEESVVETLVGSHDLCLLRILGLEVESFAATRGGPEEHLECENVDVESADGACCDGSEETHCETLMMAE